ncbi:glycosyltransferase [Carnobacterium maltaromaticum]|uniref:glycosyltransferase n=1 Tax=Carnobacterium maltaromaticum TaxID=2751 RepID=UPI000704AFDE|nr:glycosyltransferase [Carnobacterium maltaromaticum]CRH18794.1 Glycosyl transferases group 1 family protein [Carnobacterium maltaromaticum]CRH21805.1 Glycosyl transferases group 1 family protein [Carnobacterium maltaromaticum]
MQNKNEQKKILYISLVDWFWIKQRPHHIPEILSERDHVDFVCIRSWIKNDKTLQIHDTSEENLDKVVFKINDNLTVYRKKILPKGAIPLIRTLNINLFMKPFLSKLQKNNKYDAVILTHPSQFAFLDKIKFKDTKIIYDCMDNYGAFTGAASSTIASAEALLVKRADFVIVSSNNLKNKLTENYPNEAKKLTVINNGVDMKTFTLNQTIDTKETEIVKANNRKKVAYIGTISDWVNISMIYKLAKEMSNVDFYVVGPLDRHINMDEYNDLDNMIFTGPQPYYTVPAIIKQMDVMIMPFVLNEVVESVNPVKIYEYLAMGKPVIATGYSETYQFANLIETYNTETEFAELLKNQLAINSDNPDLIEKRIAFASNNSWKQRANGFKKLIEP